MWAVGNNLNKVTIYSVPMSHGGSNAQLMELSLETTDQERLSRIEWTQDGLICICQCLNSTSINFRSSIETQLKCFRIYEYVSEFKDIEIVDGEFYWIDRNVLKSTSSSFTDMNQIRSIFKISEIHILVITESSEWLLFNVGDHSSKPLQRPNNAPIDSIYGKFYRQGFCRILYTDNEGWQWMATIKSCGDYSFVRCSQGLHATKIIDVVFTTAIVVIMRESVLAIHDIETMRLLQWQPVKAMHKTSSDELFTKRILHVWEEEGLLLFNWGANSMQIWNYGRSMKCLCPPERQQSKAQSGKKADEVQKLMRYEYAEWEEEQRETAELERLRNRLNPEGMDEEELLALAISLSLSTAPLDNLHSSRDSLDETVNTEDEELRAVLERSRFEV